MDRYYIHLLLLLEIIKMSQDNIEDDYMFSVGDLVKARIRTTKTSREEIGLIVGRKAYGPYGRSYLVKWFPIKQPQWCTEHWLVMKASVTGSISHNVS